MIELQKLLLRLSDAGFEFVVIGGYAAAAHGSTIVTQDLDVCADFAVPNLMKLGSALTDLHPVHRMMPQRLPLELSPEFCQGLKNLYLDTDEGQLDILSDVTGLGPYRVVLQQSVTVELEQRLIRILSLEALIQAKKSLHRPRDKQTVLQLRALLQKREER